MMYGNWSEEKQTTYKKLFKEAEQTKQKIDIISLLMFNTFLMIAGKFENMIIIEQTKEPFFN